MADGRLNKCKACTKRDMLLHRRKNGDAIRVYDRERSKLPHRLQDGSVRAAEYRRRFPERYKANNAVQSALRSGRLVKSPCWCCGSDEVEAHHPDYSAPLDVIWLCPLHHKEIHLAYPDDHYHEAHNPKPQLPWRND